MTFRREIAVSYVSQIYVAVVGIAMIPVYIHIMGLEAYGLIAFYSMLQTGFLLLDMGLSPTMSQQVARFRGDAVTASQLRQLWRSMKLLFISFAIVGVVLLVSNSQFISSQWLQAQELPTSDIRDAIVLMSIIAALRWMTSLYRATVSGFECIAWLSGWAALASTFRFILVVPTLMIVGTSTTIFFVYQAVVSLLELIVVKRKANGLMPARVEEDRKRLGLSSIRDVLGFSLSIGFASSVYVAVTQVDKIVLSRTLSLGDYGSFSVAVLLASGIFIVSGPIGSAIMPRMARLHAEGRTHELTELYRVATQLAVALTVPVACVFAIFPRQVLWAWTGNGLLSDIAAPVLTLYALGYAVFVIAAFPYYLQFAHGDLRLHVVGNVILALVFVPSLVYGALTWGMLGAGIVWLVLNAAYFLLWVPVVHKRFLPKMHWRWLGQDVLLIVSIIAAVALSVRFTVSWPFERLGTTLQLCAIGLVLTGSAAVSGGRIRRIGMAALSSRWRLIAGRA